MTDKIIRQQIKMGGFIMKGRLLGISILLIFVLSVCVSANYQYQTWGFGGDTFGFTNPPPSTLWGSGIIGGTTPTEIVNNTNVNVQLPIIANLQKTFIGTLEQSNEVYLFGSNFISIYDRNFYQIGTYFPTGFNGSTNMAIVDRGTNFTKYELAYLSKTGTDWNLRILNRTGFGFSLVKTINITDNAYTGNIRGGSSPYAYIWDSGKNITRINLNTDVETVYPAYTTNMTRQNFYGDTPYFESDVEVGDYDRDGNDEILVIGADSANPNNLFYAGMLDTSTGTWDTQIKAPSAVAQNLGYTIASGVIGYTSAGYKIIISKRTAVSSSVYVYDFGGNLLFSKTDAYEYNFPQIADINLDGKNELLVLNSQDSMLVYDSTFSLIKTITTARTRSSETGSVLYSVGKYLPNSTWLDIVGSQGISQIDSNMTSAGIQYAFSPTGGTDSFGVIGVPVNLQSTKDIILLFRNLATRVYFSQVQGAVCGDGICEGIETALTCPSDCTPATPTQAVVTDVSISPCNTQPIMLNSTVQVKAKAETLDGSNVNIFVDFAPEGFATGCEQLANATNIISGSTQTFNFIANCTGSATITVRSNTANDPTLTGLEFPFTVSTSGSSFGDSSCGTTQPLEQIQFPSNTTTDMNDNFLTQGMKDFSAYTKLGLNILTFFILIFVSGGIFYIGSKNHYPSNTVMGLIILIDAFIVLIAANLGWINVGIVITLAIVGLIVIGLWISNLFKQTA